MIDRSVVLKRRDDVRYRIVGDEAVVIRQSEAEVLALNDVGARVLELIDAGWAGSAGGAGTTMGSLVDTMFEEYEVAREDLARDVVGFVESIREAGIVEGVSNP